MNDGQIIELFFARDEQAIRESMYSYGNYCRKIADSILPDRADAEEAVADTWLKAWETIPPQRPKYLRLYLGKITRNLALSTYRKNSAYCRGGGQVELALEELGECVSSEGSLEQRMDLQSLESAVSSFLKTEPAMRRIVFLRRYFYMDAIPDIACQYNLREANVRMMLARTRKRLKKFLIQEGYEL